MGMIGDEAGLCPETEVTDAQVMQFLAFGNDVFGSRQTGTPFERFHAEGAAAGSRTDASSIGLDLGHQRLGKS